MVVHLIHRRALEASNMCFMYGASIVLGLDMDWEGGVSIQLDGKALQPSLRYPRPSHPTSRFHRPQGST